MTERHEQPTAQEPQKEPNPLTWTGGDVFSATLQEETVGDKKRLTLEVFDGQEIVVFRFTGSVRRFSTTFDVADKAEAASGSLPAAPTQEVPLPPPAPATMPQVRQMKEDEQKPVKIVGTVATVGALDKTPKRQQPIYRFAVKDGQNGVVRHIAAFDTLAQELAAPQTGLVKDAPISLLAFKHTYTMHLHGEIKAVEEWYPKIIWYNDKVIKKPQPRTKPTRNQQR
jgi:hypothetical protein